MTTSSARTNPTPSATPTTTASSSPFILTLTTSQVQSVPASREEAEAIVQVWNVDEPGQVGALRVETVEFRTGIAN
jgi:hypothetical protein